MTTKVAAIASPYWEHQTVKQSIMMQRRTIPVGGGQGGGGPSSPSDVARIGRPGSFSTSRSGGGGVSSWVLIAIAAVLTAATYMIPEGHHAHDSGQSAHDAKPKLEYDEAQRWAAEGQEQPLGAKADQRNAADIRKAATERMLNQESKWVDGEKKLKAKLKILAARQQEGKDLGVPVATRWVGDDIPAWAGEGVNVIEWNAKIKERYDAMRVEEDHWRDMVKATLTSESRG